MEEQDIQNDIAKINGLITSTNSMIAELSSLAAKYKDRLGGSFIEDAWRDSHEIKWYMETAVDHLKNLTAYEAEHGRGA